MASVHSKLTGRQRRHRRVRKHVGGARERPRLCVFRSLRYIYAQVIDDEDGRTLVASDSREPGLLDNGDSRRNTAAARAVGKKIGERAKTAGITKVVFDRGGYLYHGRVRGVAEGAREAGLEF
ncbi:MAG TPA: 50S ribosomal protein L18 [Armatimonadota bacterium]|nr:50S ribosomal protein L18 [Armatimonadota bacterium]